MKNRFYKKLRLILLYYFIFLFFLIANQVLASGIIKPDVLKGGQEEAFTTGAGYEPADKLTLSQIVGTVIQAFLGLLGVIFVVLMIYAGYNWMMAQGEEEKVVKAKDTLKRAVIGLAITVGGYAISWWVIYRLLTPI